MPYLMVKSKADNKCIS